MPAPLPHDDTRSDSRLAAVAEALARRRVRRRGMHFERLPAIAQAEEVVACLPDAGDFIAMYDAMQRFPLPPAGRIPQ